MLRKEEMSTKANGKNNKNRNTKMIVFVLFSVVIMCIGFCELMQAHKVKSEIAALKERIAEDGITLSCPEATAPFTVFSNQLMKLDGYAFNADEWGSVQIDGNHNMKIVVGQSKITLLEEDNVILAYYITQDVFEGEGCAKERVGSVPYVYFIHSDGKLSRIRIDTEQSTPERVEGYTNIVAVLPSANPSVTAVLIDIYGNEFYLDDSL